jgi:ribosomal protein S3
MKKLIENYLIKRLNVSHPKHYYFYRWLAECIKDKDKTIDVLCSIAGYINSTNKNAGLPFLDIFVIRDYVFVVTQRPGLWIGKSGETHEAIEYRLNHTTKGDKVSDYKLEYIEDISSSQHHIGTVIKRLNKL